MKLISFFSLACLGLVIAMDAESSGDSKLQDFNDLCRAENYTGACNKKTYGSYAHLRCQLVLCVSSEKDQYDSYYSVSTLKPPQNNTPCDKNKICQDGKCVHDTMGVLEKFNYAYNDENDCVRSAKSLMALIKLERIDRKDRESNKAAPPLI